jgi:hypothetical protein
MQFLPSLLDVGESGETDHGPRIVHNTAERPIATHFLRGGNCFQSEQL